VVTSTTPPADRRVRLHMKVLDQPPEPPPGQPPTVTPQQMIDYMRAAYAPYGIDVVLVEPIETLQLDVLKDLQVGECMLRTPTDDEVELFTHRNGVPPDEICVYVVRSTIEPFAGCASRAEATGFPYGRPAAVVTRDVTSWTLGHECGHVLGLSHVTPVDNLMVSGTWRITANPPVLDGDEVTAIKNSPSAHRSQPGPPRGHPDHLDGRRSATTGPTRSRARGTTAIAWPPPSGARSITTMA
jgi:hypothetical protein